MQSILFLQSCSLPAMSFSKHFPMAYSPAFVLPFPQISSPPQHCNTSKHACLISKERILSKTPKKKRVLKYLLSQASKTPNYPQKAKPETNKFNHKSCCMLLKFAFPSLHSLQRQPTFCCKCRVKKLDHPTS